MATGREIANRLGMHPTSIQKAGFGLDDQLSNSTLIQFLSTRRKAAGAWKAEKAELADKWYQELTAGSFEKVSAVFNNNVELTSTPITEPITVVIPNREPQGSEVIFEPLPPAELPNPKISNPIKKRVPEKQHKEVIPEPIQEPIQTKGKWLESITLLDVVFYANMIVAWYGLILLLHEMGGAFGLVYSLISIHAMRMAKNRYAANTAQSGVTAIWILEALAFFIHASMFNNRAWQAAGRGELPFDAQIHSSYPFWISAILALLFSGAAIYAVSITLSLTSEKVEAENFEQKYGQKYG